jgi:hypothetical protein
MLSDHKVRLVMAQIAQQQRIGAGSNKRPERLVYQSTLFRRSNRFIDHRLDFPKIA